MRPARLPITALLLLLTLSMLGAACFKVPYTGRKAGVLLGWQQELQLGADAFAEILAAEQVVPSGTLAGTVDSVGKRVSRRTPRGFRELEWEFKLIQSDAVNAFCLPGGKIAVYTGIAPIMANEGGMASVLGHEVGHAVARHANERISGMMALQVGLSAASIGLSNTGMHDELMGMLGLGATVGVVLPFSRANELEADYIGGILMAKAGYDPRESWEVWERMQATYGGSDIAFLSTHPANSKRIERLKEALPDFDKYYKKARTQRGRGNKLAAQ
jgi:predicted Zn-dependent protease